MTSPLSPAPEASLNRATPPSKRKYDQYEVRAFTASMTTTTTHESESPRSSPFVSKVDETTNIEQENVSPSKARHSRVISGTQLSPLKILAEHRNTSSGYGGGVVMGPPMQKSPRKVSPVSRFPVKIGSCEDATRVTKERKIDMEDVVRSNDGLKTAIAIFEDDSTGMEDAEGSEEQSAETQHEQDHDEAAGPDDTMASTFSTFSVVPNLTVFAKLGQSPTKHSAFDGMTPRAKLQHEILARPPSSAGSCGNTSNLLMDFTEQMRFPHQKSPGKRGNLSPSRTMPNVSATPNRQHTNLIDFDIPPMPTPRSLPSITPRELESLKSGFLSEISSLKASLSGKEAEVYSLKTAVGDAEKRVGESMEQMREERAIKEQLSAEKEDWEKRGREMESVLRKMKSEMMTTQRDREELEQKLEESEKRREAAEMLHQEAESKMAGMRAGKDCEKSSKDASASPEKSKTVTSNREVEMAVERVARELHALYKGKHETKVAALKKSYESRWEKRVKDLESRIEELGNENDGLRDREINMTRLDPDTTVAEERKVQAVKDGAAIRELNADVQRLEAIVSTVKRDNKELRTMLEKERVEKGELVQLAEEMMSMQSIVGGSQRQQREQQTPAAVSRHQERQERADPAKTPRASGDYGRTLSIGKSGGGLGGSGIRAPGSVARAPGHIRRGSGGLPRPGRSGIMSSIEKMGSYRGRAQEGGKEV
ncbi:hypothetical protein QQS21_008770 [Conoideocrella luteorostrata]|uniref:Kinetoplast-associated protein KAP n=1 Tax=Conoideocrella luteorostrata TaxID=1105319 RepID=A0AAJ0FR41_9HYPO|nr:hypothetical protein QQS21_008770 [Conoideocrella luteorostrata]